VVLTGAPDEGENAWFRYTYFSKYLYGRSMLYYGLFWPYLAIMLTAGYCFAALKVIHIRQTVACDEVLGVYLKN
jgi:hypothetical protein